uniref:Uncharacterized protein n=1 Tax=Romanomermis culicivorax TaxID=13658 RepID=A0A915IU72_ROMCU
MNFVMTMGCKNDRTKKPMGTPTRVLLRKSRISDCATKLLIQILERIFCGVMNNKNSFPALRAEINYRYLSPRTMPLACEAPPKGLAFHRVPKCAFL